MEEAPENSKESSHAAHANGMNEWMNRVGQILTLRMTKNSLAVSKVYSHG